MTNYMKLNKLMTVLSVCASMAAAGVCAGDVISGFPYGVTNVPLSLSGTLYLYQGGYETSLDSATTNKTQVKTGGNLLSKVSSYTTNYTIIATNGSAYGDYGLLSLNNYGYVSALNYDPTFRSAYPMIPTNAQIYFNARSQEFWLMTTNFAFNLSSNWWSYSWTNVYTYDNYTVTNFNCVSNTFVSQYSPASRYTSFDVWYMCGSLHTNYYTNYLGNNADYTDNLYTDKHSLSYVKGYTGNLNNLTSSSYNGFNSATNVQIGEIYLSTGTNLTMALVGPSIITGTQALKPTTTYTNGSAATTIITVNASLAGAVYNIWQTGGSSSLPYNYNTNNWTSILNQFGDFIGTSTGSQTATTKFFFVD